MVNNLFLSQFFERVKLDVFLTFMQIKHPDLENNHLH